MFFSSIAATIPHIHMFRECRPLGKVDKYISLHDMEGRRMEEEGRERGKGREKDKIESVRDRPLSGIKHIERIDLTQLQGYGNFDQIGAIQEV